MEEKWLELTVLNYLKELRKQVEKECKKDGYLDSKDGEEYKKEKLRLKKSGMGGNESDAKTLLRKGIKIIIERLKGLTNPKDTQILKDASLVIKSIEDEEKLIESLLPDLAKYSQGRWPGPVRYRATLNHLVAVSIRVHSMYPDVKFETVIRSVSRRIIVPAIAHNLTFLRRDHGYLFNFLLKSDDGLEKLKKGHQLNIKDISIKNTSKSLDIDEPVKWVRFLNTLLHFMREIKNYHELVSEIQRLALEHEVNPNSSSLWNELSLIASGDLSVDEILVSKVAAELDISSTNVASKPIISCARARFGLLRFSYGMTEERELINNEYEIAIKRTDEYFESINVQDNIDENTARQGFGWAYLWSRYLLIKIHGPSIHHNTDKPGVLIENILCRICHHAESEDYKKLALRYLTGFLTNPRFIRPKIYLKDLNRATMYIKQMEDIKLPGGLISLMKARVLLHKAFEVIEKDHSKFKELLQHSLSHYADTLSSINAVEKSDTMMDGEVSAWAIPEMIMSIGLLKDTIIEKGNTKKSQTYTFIRLQKALDTIAEMQFGVYFDKDEEDLRLKKGLKLATKF